MGVKNLKSVGKSSLALGNMRRYDCLIVTSATPAISPISERENKIGIFKIGIAALHKVHIGSS